MHDLDFQMAVSIRIQPAVNSISSFNTSFKAAGQWQYVENEVW